jgi:hypothetical protein
MPNLPTQVMLRATIYVYLEQVYMFKPLPHNVRHSQKQTQTHHCTCSEQDAQTYHDYPAWFIITQRRVVVHVSSFMAVRVEDCIQFPRGNTSRGIRLIHSGMNCSSVARSGGMYNRVTIRRFNYLPTGSRKIHMYIGERVHSRGYNGKHSMPGSKVHTHALP